MSTKFHNYDGEKPMLEFKTQKVYGKPLTHASQEEFLALLPECENSNLLRKLVDELSAGKVYEVNTICVCKGHVMPAATYTVISTYFCTFFISQGGETKGYMEINLDGRTIALISDCSEVKVFYA